VLQQNCDLASSLRIWSCLVGHYRLKPRGARSMSCRSVPYCSSSGNWNFRAKSKTGSSLVIRKMKFCRLRRTPPSSEKRNTENSPTLHVLRRSNFYFIRKYNFETGIMKSKFVVAAKIDLDGWFTQVDSAWWFMLYSEIMSSSTRIMLYWKLLIGKCHAYVCDIFIVPRFGTVLTHVSCSFALLTPAAGSEAVASEADLLVVIHF
jgi:hypothetical protein